MTKKMSCTLFYVDGLTNHLNEIQYNLGFQLKPVFRTKDLAEFDLERAFKAVAAVATVIGSERS